MRNYRNETKNLAAMLQDTTRQLHRALDLLESTPKPAEVSEDWIAWARKRTALTMDAMVSTTAMIAWFTQENAIRDAEQAEEAVIQNMSRNASNN